MAQESQSVFAWGKLQTNYTTEVAIANDGFRQICKEGYEKPVFSSPNVGNEGYSTGSAFATKTSKDKDDVTFSGSERATFELLGFLAAMGFGVVASPTTVTTGVYTQLFSLLDPFISDVLPTRPLVSKVGEPAISGNRVHDVRFPSMMNETLTFSNAGNNPDLQVSGSFRGSGKRVNPSGVQFYGSGKDVLHDDEMTEHFVKRTAGTLTLNDGAAFGGADVELGCDFRDTTITINQNLNTEAGYEGCALFQDDDPDKGAIRGKMTTKGQTVTWESTMVLSPALVTDFDPVEKMIEGAAISAKLKFIGAAITVDHDFEATFTLNKAVIDEVELVQVDGGTQGIRIKTKPLAVSNTMPLTLLLKTDVANFNTYVG